ncbi:MAG: hypothetical protein JNM58_14205 [Xanthomonadaceae bacterium]|nr:hypothetical protein [Xanthomonadaceae bacterium]
MSMLRPLLPLALLAAFALSPDALARKPIEQDMTPEEFKAAGLDKLSPEELAKLNTWLGRKIDTAATEAASEAKKKVEDDNRGFFHFGSMDPITGRLQGEFRGFSRGREYTLENGHVWRQVDDAQLSGVRMQAPEVTLKPAMIGNVWYMGVKGYNTKAKVERVK